MAQYDNRNTAVLFQNDKQGNEARPDMTGKITLEDGTEKRIAAWWKEGRSGQFLSIRVSDFMKKNDGGQQGYQQPQPQQQTQDPLDDDLPF